MSRSRYSSGKRSYLIDDRTGRKIRYRDARTEWTGLRVHKNELEEKHPQLTPPRVDPEPQNLWNPRPDGDDEGASVDFRENGRVGVGARGVVEFSSHGASGSAIEISPDLSGIEVTGTIGVESVATAIVETGVSGTGAIGTAIAPFVASGVAGTSALGIETLTSISFPSGQVGTMSEGSEGVTLTITETGLVGTGSVGTAVASVDSSVWGSDAWGDNTWGD